MGKLQLAILAAVVQSVFSLMEFPDCVGLLKDNTVCNTSASPSERAAALVAAMTLTEKLGNLVEYA
jgi:beta-D-xylosidase 4